MYPFRCALIDAHAQKHKDTTTTAVRTEVNIHRLIRKMANQTKINERNNNKNAKGKRRYTAISIL